MPWLPLYLNKTDLETLISWLNAETEIAYIVSDGPKKWKAVHGLPTPVDGRHCLWHTESGPLPLLRKLLPDGEIHDPWSGWKEARTGANSSCPYFGAGHPGVYWLNAHTDSKRESGALGMSSFEWIGNRYRAIGHGAPEVARKWWGRLGRWAKKQAMRIPREGPCEGPHPEIWAFPSALAEIKDGRPRAPNP